MFSCCPLLVPLLCPSALYSMERAIDIFLRWLTSALPAQKSSCGARISAQTRSRSFCERVLQSLQSLEWPVSAPYESSLVTSSAVANASRGMRFLTGVGRQTYFRQLAGRCTLCGFLTVLGISGQRRLLTVGGQDPEGREGCQPRGAGTIWNVSCVRQSVAQAIMRARFTALRFKVAAALRCWHIGDSSYDPWRIRSS